MTTRRSRRSIARTMRRTHSSTLIASFTESAPAALIFATYGEKSFTFASGCSSFNHASEEVDAGDRGPNFSRDSGAPNDADVAIDPVRGMVRTFERYGPFTEFVVGAPDAKLGNRYIYAVGAPYNGRVLSDPVDGKHSRSGS